jgi:hypothetical protein
MASFSSKMIRAIRVAGVLIALALIGVWIWFCEGIVGVALDYPVRRAGETVFGYPPRDTFAFYWNCTKVLAKYFAVMSPYWVVPLALALIALFYSLAIRSTTVRILITSMVLLGPIIGYSIYNIFFYHS